MMEKTQLEELTVQLLENIKKNSMKYHVQRKELFELSNSDDLENWEKFILSFQKLLDEES